MTPYVISEGIFTDALVEARDLAEGFMADLPDPEPGAPACQTLQRGKDEPKTYWSCHGLVRAYARLHPEWTVLDGFFGPMKHQHSWLFQYTSRRDGGVIILDLYPVGALLPMLVDASSASPWRALYVESTIFYRPAERERWEREADYALALYRQAQESEKDPPRPPPPPPEEDHTVVAFRPVEEAPEVPPKAPDPPPAAFTRPMVADRPPPMRESFVPVPERQAPLIGSPAPAVTQAAPRPQFRAQGTLDTQPGTRPAPVEEPKRRFRLGNIGERVAAGFNDFLERHRVGG